MPALFALLALLACESDPAPAAPDEGPVALDTAAEVVPGRFGFPIPERERIDALVGVDHDPVVQTGILAAGLCDDYLGRPFPHCYDEHDGSDYLLDGGFPAMDAGSPDVVAAEDGVVVDAHDGEYDRCHVEGTGISCDGNSGIANYVILEHTDGWRTLYWHLQKDSVGVAVGDEVTCGEVVGRIGSSGYSSAPHLHFEVQDASGAVVDPYAGPYSQPESEWAGQGLVDELPEPGCTQP
ncbi:MAG: M23 family metallopeptidase [Deltaproteobacteria bacterium]|nr:M23 family metallopeptidase [Deltaproteobacteria bacterium]